ncbi:MAG TPA: nucleotidyltransferase family protein [Candidatus Methylomirabilis sp.]|nr:nucleotidyltransferase family protein [Candidatus Methylomirabilis sp.]
MKSLDEIRTIITKHRDVLAEQYGVAVVGVFGSYVRGNVRQGSDIDLLADILRPISLFEIVGAELYLSDLLGEKVDLVPKRDVREELRETILREAVSL